MQKMLLIFILFLSQVAFSKNPDPYVEKLRDKTYLKLPDGREIIISYPLKYNEGVGEKVRVFMRSGARVLWDKTFAEDFGTLWHEAYFIPVKTDYFVADLNDDSIQEIAIAVWSGGNASQNSLALIFSVKDKSLQLFKKEPIAIEFARSVYK